MEYEDNEDREYFEYLEVLRASGEINMFASPVHLQKEFGLSRQEAKDVFLSWTKVFKH